MNINRSLICLLLAGLLVSLGTACQRQNNVQADRAAAPAVDKKVLTADEQAIATKIEQAHIGEMDLGRLAKDRASDKDVKDYADMIVDDHQDALKKIANILKKKDATDASAEAKPADAQAELSKLQSMSGAAFDTEFVSAMIMDHQKTLDQLQRDSAMVQNPDLKDYMNDLTKTVGKHLEKAQELQTKMASKKH